ncbi:MAG TPA: PIN domain-containing protein [Longimicrobium sp.]|nr:PIN domain-containing protein [Longimicrobium sp.]
MSNRGPVALLDANVLYSATVRDLLLTLAEADLLVPHWTEEIHNEWISNLLRKRPDLDSAALARTRAQMDAAFPKALVSGYQRHIPAVQLPDPADAHVVAAAIEAGADVIVTFNLRHFPPSSLHALGIVAVDPDRVVLELLRTESRRCCDAIARRRQRFRNPPLTAEQFLASLERANLAKTSLRLRDLVDRI